MLKTTLRRSAQSEDGQALVEYALILFLIALVSIGVLTLFGLNLSSIIDEIAAQIGAL